MAKELIEICSFILIQHKKIPSDPSKQQLSSSADNASEFEVVLKRRHDTSIGQIGYKEINYCDELYSGL